MLERQQVDCSDSCKKLFFQFLADHEEQFMFTLVSKELVVGFCDLCIGCCHCMDWGFTRVDGGNEGFTGKGSVVGIGHDDR